MREGWTVAKFGEVIESSLIGLVRNKKEQDPGFPFRYFKMNNISNDNRLDDSKIVNVDANTEEVEKFSLRNGDFLFNTRNSHELVGKSCLFKSDSTDVTLFNNNIMRIRFKSELDAAFLSCAFSSKSIIEQLERIKSGTTNVAAIYYKTLQNVLVAFPPLPEQKRIVAILDEAFAGIATVVANTEKNLASARELFDSHLNNVFTHGDDGWVEKPLSEVCQFIGGSQPPKSVFSKVKADGYVRLIQIRDYKTDRHIVYIPLKQARRSCNSDDVMIGRYGPPVFQILRGLTGAYNVALMKAVPDENVISKDFLFFFLQNKKIQQHIIRLSNRAAGQTGITKEALETYPIVYPPLSKQSQIVQTIVDISAETHRLESLYQHKRTTLADLKQSILHKAFSGALTSQSVSALQEAVA